jgi:hypothetical protein
MKLHQVPAIPQSLACVAQSFKSTFLKIIANPMQLVKKEGEDIPLPCFMLRDSARSTAAGHSHLADLEPATLDSENFQAHSQF